MINRISPNPTTHTLTILPVEARRTATGERVDAMLTGAAILARDAGTVIDVDCQIINS